MEDWAAETENDRIVKSDGTQEAIFGRVTTAGDARVRIGIAARRRWLGAMIDDLQLSPRSRFDA